MPEKPIELIMTLVAAGYFVWTSNKHRPVLTRGGVTVSSLLLGGALGPEIADRVFGSVILATMLVGCFGWAILELGVALINDHRKVVEIVRAWRGK